MTNFATKQHLKTRVADALASSNHSVVAGSPLVANTQSASSDNIQIKYFVSDHDSAPRSADYINRIRSLINAAKSLTNDAETIAKLDKLLEQTKKNLYIECNVDKELADLKEEYQIKFQANINHESLTKEYQKQRLKIIEKINEHFNEIIFRVIWGTNKPRNFFTRLLRPITKSLLGDVFADNIIRFIRQPDETNANAIARLKAAEIELVKQDGRPELINVFFTPEKSGNVTELYYTYQAPVSRYTNEQRERLGENISKDKYFYPASVNNTEGVANFNREVVGKIDGNTSEILRKFYTHCALPPLGIKDEVKRLGITARNAEQIVGILAEQRLAEGLSTDSNALINNNAENPLAVEMTEIRLLSLMRSNFIFDFFDKSQHQYEQTLEMFLAFNMLNNKTFKTSVTLATGLKCEIYVKPNIRFGNFGVNGFRNEIFADELLDFINTRYLNQVFAANISEIVDEEEYSNLDPAISAAYRTAHQKAEVQQQVLDVQFYRLHQLLKAAETNSAATPQYQEQRKTIMKLLEAQHEQQKVLLNHQKDFIQQLSKANISLDSTSQERLDNLVQIKELIETPLHSWVKNAVSTISNLGFIPQVFKNFMGQFSASLGNVFDKYFCFLKRYTFAENNYHLQNILARLNDAEGRELLIGCRENKDRGGRMNATLMTDAIYKDQDQHHRCANYANAEHKSVFNRLLAWVLPRSTAFFNSELCSVPGARGFDIQSSHGNEHLDFLRENKGMARWGKDVFSTALGFSIVDTAIKVKNWVAKKFSRPEPTENNNQSPRRNYNTFSAVTSFVTAGTLAAALAVASAPAADTFAPSSAYQPAGISDLATGIDQSDSVSDTEGLDGLTNITTAEGHFQKAHETRLETSAGRMMRDLIRAEKELKQARKELHKDLKKKEKDDVSDGFLRDPDPKNPNDLVAVMDNQRRKDRTKPEKPEPKPVPEPGNPKSHQEIKSFISNLFAHRLKPSGSFKIEPAEIHHTELHHPEDSSNHHSSSPPKP